MLENKKGLKSITSVSTLQNRKGQTKLRESPGKKIIQFKEEINEIDNRKSIVKIKETKSYLSEKII